jgi:hypothetical protein
MPIEDLKSDMAAVSWSVGTLKENKRKSYSLIGPELKAVNMDYPYAVRLEEKPYQTSGVEITGYTESESMPTSSTEFYVDYEDSMVYFYSSEAGKLVSIYYYGMGSVVAADDVNRFANFLCSVRSFLTSFQVQAFDPEDQNVNVTGGYINTGTDLVNIADKILKFGTDEEFETTAMSVFYWMKLLVSINTSTEEIVVTEGTATSTLAAATIPTIPSNCKPIAVASIQDDGNAGAGTIANISDSDIDDVRILVK